MVTGLATQTIHREMESQRLNQTTTLEIGVVRSIDMCGAYLCEECGASGLCSRCAELWEAEIDLEDTEAEEE